MRGSDGPPKRPSPTPVKEERLSAPPVVADLPGTFTFADIFTRRVEDRSATTAVHLQKAERIERGENQLEVVSASGTPSTMLQSNEHKAVLDAGARQLIGKPVSVSLIMKEQDPKGELAGAHANAETLV